MVNLIFNYLLESSLCLVLFIATYKLLIAHLTNFSWIRFYLLVSLTLSLILPLIIIPIELSAKLIPTGAIPDMFLMPAKQATNSVVNNNPDSIQDDSGVSILDTTLFIAFIVYMIVVIYKSYLFVRNLKKIYGFIKKSSKVKEGNYWVVFLKGEIPAFSFFNYIFINSTYKNLSSDELYIIKRHEMVHVRQYHSFDVLFIELASIIFWFNPVVSYLKKSLKEIHEYIVDEKIAGHGENKKAYAQLLLVLASDTKVFDLAASFTGEHIKRRILMLEKTRTSAKYKLTFFVLVPLTTMLLLSFSYLKNPKANSEIQNEIRSLKLKKYCGVYFPSKRDINFGLKPMKIIFKDDKLFAEGTIALHFEADSIFSYTDNSARTIKFDFDSKKEVTGCALLKFEIKENANYIVLKGEYLKK